MRTPSATWSVVKAELRDQRRTVALVLLAAVLVSGAVFTAAAGARRTASVLDRFLDSQGDPELLINVSQPRVAADPDQIAVLESELAALPGVREVVPAVAFYAGVGIEEDFTVLTGPDSRYLGLAHPLMLQGIMPSVDSSGEVALNESGARLLGLSVGDTLVSSTFSVGMAEDLFAGLDTEFALDGPELRLEVVGVYRDTDALAVDAAPSGIASPDAGSFIGEAGAFDTVFFMRGDFDDADIGAATTALNQAVPDGYVYAVERADTAQPARTAFDVIAGGLAIFAAVALVAGFVAVGQIVSRQVAQNAVIASALSALGMRRREIALTAALPSILAVTVGVMVGAIAAIALSPRFPVAVARRAEVDPGILVDWPVLVGGSVLLIGATASWALIAAHRFSRRRDARVSRRLSARGLRIRRALPVTAGIGCGSVLAPPRGRAGANPGLAITGAVLAVGGVIAIALFTTSQQAVAGDPSRFGWNWDSQPDIVTEDAEPVVAALTEDPRIDAVGRAFCDTVLLRGTATSACGLQALSGSLALTYPDGRAPTSPDEVAIGARTLSALDAELGDNIEVANDSGTVKSLTIVGTVVQPDELAPAEGLVVTEPAFTQLADGDHEEFLILKYRQGEDPEALEAALASEYPLAFYNHPLPPPTVSQLDRVRPALYALAAFLVLLGFVGGMHFLLLSSSRRSGNSAVLKALGFVRRQTFQVVVWQALTIAIIAVAVGVPLGVIVGRSVWIAAVDQIGIDHTPVAPLLVMAIVSGVSIVGAVAVALFPGWLAARRSPADALRTE